MINIPRRIKSQIRSKRVKETALKKSWGALLPWWRWAAFYYCFLLCYKEKAVEVL